MDAVALAKEFTEARLTGDPSARRLDDWLFFKPELMHLHHSEISELIDSVQVALDSKIIISIK
jgi:hypothetical protein